MALRWPSDYGTGPRRSPGPSLPDLDLADTAQVRRVLVEIGQNYLDYRLVAQAEAEKRAELSTAAETLVSVPYFDTDVHDFAGLMQLGAGLWGE